MHRVNQCGQLGLIPIGNRLASPTLTPGLLVRRLAVLNLCLAEPNSPLVRSSPRIDPSRIIAPTPGNHAKQTNTSDFSVDFFSSLLAPVRLHGSSPAL